MYLIFKIVLRHYHPDPPRVLKLQNFTKNAHPSISVFVSLQVSHEPLFVNGVWGPYYSAMVPGLWLNEGGQSATGKLV